MVISINFGLLKQHIAKIGAKLVHYDLNLKIPDPLSEIVTKLVEDGLAEVELNDVESNSGGLLSFKGYQVVLYIQDHGKYVNQSLSGHSSYKFHIAECEQLEKMRNLGRYQRYHVSTNKSDQFKVSGNPRGKYIEGYARLKVCKLCLKALNYKGYKNKPYIEKNKIVDQFDIGQFFSIYSSFFKELPGNSENDNKTYYTEDWEQVAKSYKERIGWTCEQCGVYLSQHNYRKLLHVHHQNGVKGDNRHENFKALCKDCHSKQVLHDHIFVTKHERQLINRLRSKQGINVKNDGRTENWDEVFELVDPAMEGFLDMCKKSGYPAPTIGLDITIDGRVQSQQLEVAWEHQKTAVVIDKDDFKNLNLRQSGWKLFSLDEAMKWF